MREKVRELEREIANYSRDMHISAEKEMVGVLSKVMAFDALLDALDRIAADNIKGKVSVQRFKGLGEMNPMQLRETTVHPDTRRLVQLVIEHGDETNKVMDMLLAKKRAADRKAWLQERGDLAEVSKRIEALESLRFGANRRCDH